MENYLEDLLTQLIDEAKELKETANSEFEKGKLIGYYDAISKILNQAEAFGINLPAKWIKYNPEDLL